MTRKEILNNLKEEIREEIKYLIYEKKYLSVLTEDIEDELEDDDEEFDVDAELERPDDEPEGEPELPVKEPDTDVDQDRIKSISRANMVRLIRAIYGQPFTVTFIKKDGSKRVMHAQQGVTKHLKGGSLRYDPRAYNLMPVYDLDKKAYRILNLNTLLTLRIKNKFYKVK